MSDAKFASWPYRDIFTYTEKANVVNLIARALSWTNPVLNPECGKVEPPAEYRIAGIQAYANGTDWNPGAGGEGIYFYNAAGVWTKL